MSVRWSRSVLPKVRGSLSRPTKASRDVNLVLSVSRFQPIEILVKFRSIDTRMRDIEFNTLTSTPDSQVSLIRKLKCGVVLSTLKLIRNFTNFLFLKNMSYANKSKRLSYYIFSCDLISNIYMQYLCVCALYFNIFYNKCNIKKYALHNSRIS